MFITQAQLTELQADNERLTEEKGVLLESLCRQTEKLEDSRSKVDMLQGLLLREEQPQEASKGYNTEREQKLVDLLKVSIGKNLHPSRRVRLPYNVALKRSRSNPSLSIRHYCRVRKRNVKLCFRSKKS